MGLVFEGTCCAFEEVGGFANSNRATVIIVRPAPDR